MEFRIEYSPESEQHPRQLTTRQQAVILDEIEKQRQHDPVEKTRNRKRMQPNPVPPWELRVGGVRVYFEFQIRPKPVVFIRAIGVKSHNRVTIGGDEVDL